MAGYGVPEAEIAALVGIDAKTLRKHYRHELDHGHIKANAKVAENLYRMATGEGREAVTAAIFWLKARAGGRKSRSMSMAGRRRNRFESIVIKRIIISPPDREELRKLPGLAINDPNWPGDPLE